MLDQFLQDSTASFYAPGPVGYFDYPALELAAA
jgi:hypothetical protein